MKYFLPLFFIFFSANTYAQSFDTEFGKNRVQYNDDFKYWNRYETDNFITYWYGKSKMIARTVMPLAEMDHADIQSLIEHRVNDKLQILVYSDIADLKQSNIGSESSFTSKTGQTKIAGNKMFVYFDGDHQHLRKQIREGIASVYINAMMFGTGIQEIVQNAVLLDLPDWFKVGLVSFAGSHWDELIEDELRELVAREEDYLEFDNLVEDHPRVAGHSMWYYISQNYGKSSISNILYLNRISRSFENSLNYTLNTTPEKLYEEWQSFYRRKYELEDGLWDKREDQLVVTKNKKYVPISTFSYDKTGTNIAYAYNNLGKIRIDVLNLERRKSKTVFKYGSKNNLQETDFNYPLISWHENGDLSIIYEHRDRIYLKKILFDKDEEIEQVLPEDFHRVYSMDAMDDRFYIFTANTDGFSDIYKYDAKYRNFERITTDYFDDLDASLGEINDKKGIVFSSNRKQNHIFPESFDTILPIDDFDIFFYDLETNDGSLMKLTNTPLDNERYPKVRNNEVYFLSNGSGIINQYKLNVENNNVIALTNESRNLIRHDVDGDAEESVRLLYDHNAYQLYRGKNLEPREVPVTDYRKAMVSFDKNKEEALVIVKEEQEVEEVPKGMFFMSEFEDPSEIEPIEEEDLYQNFEKENVKIFKRDNEDFVFPKYVHSRTIAAGLKFRLDNFVTKADNEVLFEGLETFSGDRTELGQAALGILLKATIKDLFEDYVIEGGVRLPTSFDGSEYFVTFENKKKLLDRKFILYRKSQSLDPLENDFSFTNSKKQSLLGMYQVKYPFDVYTSLRATAMLRFDKFFYKSTDQATFESPFVHEKRIGLKVEYIFDNTLEKNYNTLHGTRYKFYVEVLNQFNFELADGINIDLNQGFTGAIGVDARHYIPVLGKSVLALRGTAAGSFGSKPMLYMLGGVNNWLIPQFDNSIPVAEREFSLKTYVPHLRGFDYNIRNGTSYALANVELRVPIFRYFLKRGRGVSFFRNMQVVFFGDAGTAWYGNGPFSDENPINTTNISAPPTLELEIQYYRDPLVIGYGAGIHTTLLGYFIKLDYARGIETRKVGDGKFYLSMGLDF